MIKKVIGIISWLPDKTESRSRRFNKLKKLIQTCNSLFHLPIMIIAQNWTEIELNQIQNVQFFTYDKLGIVGARNKLREHFLQSDYDYLIMLDDDCTLYADQYSAEKYLKQIDEHPSGFGEFKKTLLKLFAISKDVFSLEAFDENIKPEDSGGFEDRVFVNKLRDKYPEKRYIFERYSIQEYSLATADPDSTWYCGQNLQEMLNNTENAINKNKLN